jgi:hypothetical protein
METNYSRWKPILLVCRFSDPYFYFFFRRSPFSACDDHSTSSLFRTFIDALGTSLAISPFYGVCKANYSALPSSFLDEADFQIFVNFLAFL